MTRNPSLDEFSYAAVFSMRVFLFEFWDSKKLDLSEANFESFSSEQETAAAVLISPYVSSLCNHLLKKSKIFLGDP